MPFLPNKTIKIIDEKKIISNNVRSCHREPRMLFRGVAISPLEHPKKFVRREIQK